MIVHAPLAGVVVALVDVPDPVFADGLVGPGLAIEPDDDAVDVTAPVDGVLEAVRPHAFVVRADPPATRPTRPDRPDDVLVHLGIDTVGADLFTLHLAPGDRCAVGQRVVAWDPAEVVGRGLHAVCPVVVLQAVDDAVRALVEPGTRVTAGLPLLEVRTPA